MENLKTIQSIAGISHLKLTRGSGLTATTFDRDIEIARRIASLPSRTRPVPHRLKGRQLSRSLPATLGPIEAPKSRLTSPPNLPSIGSVTGLPSNPKGKKVTENGSINPSMRTATDMRPGIWNLPEPVVIQSDGKVKLSPISSSISSKNQLVQTYNQTPEPLQPSRTSRQATLHQAPPTNVSKATALLRVNSISRRAVQSVVAIRSRPHRVDSERLIRAPRATSSMAKHGQVPDIVMKPPKASIGTRPASFVLTAPDSAFPKRGKPWGDTGGRTPFQPIAALPNVVSSRSVPDYGDTSEAEPGVQNFGNSVGDTRQYPSRLLTGRIGEQPYGGTPNVTATLLVELTGDIMIDGRRLGQLTASSQAREASLPPLGQSRVNPRTAAVYTGTRIPQ